MRIQGFAYLAGRDPHIPVTALGLCYRLHGFLISSLSCAIKLIIATCVGFLVRGWICSPFQFLCVDVSNFRVEIHTAKICKSFHVLYPVSRFSTAAFVVFNSMFFFSDRENARSLSHSRCRDSTN